MMSPKVHSIIRALTAELSAVGVTLEDGPGSMRRIHRDGARQDVTFYVEVREDRSEVSAFRSRPSGKHRIIVSDGRIGSSDQYPERKTGHDLPAIAARCQARLDEAIRRQTELDKKEADESRQLEEDRTIYAEAQLILDTHKQGGTAPLPTYLVDMADLIVRRLSTVLG